MSLSIFSGVTYDTPCLALRFELERQAVDRILPEAAPVIAICSHCYHHIKSRSESPRNPHLKFSL